MLELFAVGLTLALAAGWVAAAPKLRRTEAARLLNRYAQSRGLLYEPPMRVLATQDSVELVVDLYRLAGEIRTRVSAAAKPGPPLSIAKRGAFAWKRESTFVFGDAALDRAWVINAGAADDPERLRQLDLGRFEERDGVWLATSSGRVSLSWRGVERDPVLLDAARALVVNVARWHRTDLPYR